MTLSISLHHFTALIGTGDTPEREKLDQRRAPQVASSCNCILITSMKVPINPHACKLPGLLDDDSKNVIFPESLASPFWECHWWVAEKREKSSSMILTTSLGWQWLRRYSGCPITGGLVLRSSLEPSLSALESLGETLHPTCLQCMWHSSLLPPVCGCGVT